MMYHGFLVSFQVALDSTTKTGQTERTRPIHSIQSFFVVSRAGTAMELICVFPLLAKAYSPTKNREETEGNVKCSVVIRCPAASPAVKSARSCRPVCGFQMARTLSPRKVTFVSMAFGDELAKK